MVGMGRDLRDKYPPCGDLMGFASAATGIDLGKICYEGPDEDLGKTQNTQPALLTVSAMALAAFRSKSNRQPDFVAGHSLGEFSALFAAGAFGFEDAVRIVRKRGEYMSQASGGGMAAVLGLDAALIEEVCREASGQPGDLQPANYNGDAQTVIAGTKAALERATPKLLGKGAKKVVLLNVSAAFHSPFMQSAAEKLAVDLAALVFNPLSVPLVNNVDAKVVTDATEAREGVRRQVMGAVRWTDVMRVLLENNVRTIIEFGPGKTLLGMFKRMDKTLTLCNVEDGASLEKTLETLNENA